MIFVMIYKEINIKYSIIGHIMGKTKRIKNKIKFFKYKQKFFKDIKIIKNIQKIIFLN